MQRNESTTRAVRTAGARNTTNLALAALVVVAGMAGTTHAAIKTWDGITNAAGTPINTNFGTKENWDLDVAPISGDSATIGGTFAATMDGSLPNVLTSLTIGSTASLTNSKTGGSYQRTRLRSPTTA